MNNLRLLRIWGLCVTTSLCGTYCAARLWHGHVDVVGWLFTAATAYATITLIKEHRKQR